MIQIGYYVISIKKSALYSCSLLCSSSNKFKCVCLRKNSNFFAFNILLCHLWDSIENWQIRNFITNIVLRNYIWKNSNLVSLTRNLGKFLLLTRPFAISIYYLAFHKLGVIGTLLIVLLCNLCHRGLTILDLTQAVSAKSPFNSNLSSIFFNCRYRQVALLP